MLIQFRYKISISLMTFFFTFSVNAKIIEDPTRAGFVKDSYIITFKKPGKGEAPTVLPPKAKGNRGKIAFIQHSSGQNKKALAAQLQLDGKIMSILEYMNAIHVHMSAEEADRLRNHQKVANIQQGKLVSIAAAPSSWALDRMDNSGPYLNQQYNPSANIGTGRTIYVLDTGIAYDNAIVRNAFKVGTNQSRLFIYDLTDSYVNPLSSPPLSPPLPSLVPLPSNPDIEFYSADHHERLRGIGLPTDNASGNSHGTVVAVAIAGKINGISYGIATGATIVSVKIASTAPSGGNIFSDSNTETVAFNWLGTYGRKGDIVNWSRGVFDDTCGMPNPPTTGGETIDTNLETAMIAAHNNGIIIVVAAHNDGCNDDSLNPDDGHTPIRLGRLDGVIVVGGTSQESFNVGQDKLFKTNTRRSRTGIDISVFAPAKGVATLQTNGSITFGNGTSMAIAITSGMIAAACSALEVTNPNQYCDVIPPQLRTKLIIQGNPAKVVAVPDFAYYAGPHPLYKLIRDIAEQGTVYHNNTPVLGYQSVIDSSRQSSRFLDKSYW